jgi:Flp pilus assembly pilin Flp
MVNRFSTLFNRAKACTLREDGQDLVEYGLVIALIAFTVIAGLKSVSTDISMIYSAIASTVTSSVSS